MFVDIAFPISSYNIFTYSVPQKFKSQVDIGSRVTAPLGKRSTTDIIIGFPKKPVFTGTIKSIESLVDSYPVLDKTLWKLVHWMSTYYFTPMGQVAKTVLPAQLSMKYLPQKTWIAEVLPNAESDDLLSSAFVQRNVVDFLHKEKGMFPVTGLKHLASNPMNVCRILEKKVLLPNTVKSLNL